jgi:acetyl esterase/lipase
MKTIFTLITIMSIFTACNRAEEQPIVLPTNQPYVARNVGYGSDTLQRMDVYLPANRNAASTPALVLIHGGGWTGGSKTEFDAYIDTLQRRLPEYAIFNIDYRLANGNNLFPTQEQDVKAAIDFISSKASSYSISTNHVSLLGFSAGGHLALLQGYKYGTPKVKAVIDFFGPTDLVTMYNNPWHQLVPYALQMITGATPQSKPELYRNSSPVNFITPQTPPTLILHGGLDNIVDISQSRLLKTKLDAVGVANELIVYPNERHGWYGSNLTHSFNQVERFLRQNVR